MFKCKQCGRQFGANVPRTCPRCGAACNTEHRGVRRFIVFGVFGALWELVIIVAVAALAVLLLGRLLGWF